MKQWVYISLMLLSTVFLLSCKDDELENVNVEDRMPELTLKFTEAEISRTSLNSSEPLQHVENVKLYIYQMVESKATEGTPETAEQFVQRIQDASLYATETLPWKNQSTSSGVSMSYKIQKPLEPDREYVFLAVGTDAESEENYEFPDNGTKFSASVATLKDGKTIQDMAKSEFFSGYQVAKLCRPGAGSKSILAPLKKDDAGNYSYDTADQTTVELTRAVAGVLLYMTDIPAKWIKAGESGDGYRVTKVKLRLHRMPASSVSLCGQSTETGSDTGASTEEGPVLIESMDLSELQFPSEGDLYQIVGQKGEVQTLDNTLLYGAYLLPVASEAGKATFTLELWGKECEENGTIKDGETEIELDQFDCFLEEANSSSDFAIERNHVYCIGQKPVADDTEGDAPVSLAGKEIVVDVQDWMPISNDIEFPYVDTNAKFNPDFDPGYIFNCINASFTLPIVCNSNSKWELSVVYDSEDNKDWLYIYQENEQQWKNIYIQDKSDVTGVKTNSKDLTLFIEDYAEFRSNYADANAINNDVRSATLVLITKSIDEKGNEVIIKRNTLKITQYNAITVIFGDGKYKVGFSRLDVGDVFKKKSSSENDNNWIGISENESRKAFGWGVWDTAIGSVSKNEGDDDGNDILTGLYDQENRWTTNIALSEAVTINYYIDSNGQKMPADENYKIKICPKDYVYNFWYLPAQNELLNFINTLVKYELSWNLQLNQYYWTSTTHTAIQVGVIDWEKASIVCRYTGKMLDKSDCEAKARKNGLLENEAYYNKNCTESIFIRPCVKFDNRP